MKVKLTRHCRRFNSNFDKAKALLKRQFCWIPRLAAQIQMRIKIKISFKETANAAFI